MKKILFLMFLICVGYLFTLNEIASLVVGCIGLLFYFLFLKKKEIATDSQDSEKSPEKRLDSSIKKPNMSETQINSFIKSKNSNVKITQLNRILIAENFRDLFCGWRNGNSVYPPIDPIFDELLQDGSFTDKIVSQFSVLEGTQPYYCFTPFKKERTEISMTAKEILFHFLENKQNYTEKNWFVLNTKPHEPKENITDSDLRFVNIWKQSNGMFFLHCSSYGRWSSLSGSSINIESSFYIPTPLTENTTKPDEIKTLIEA